MTYVEFCRHYPDLGRRLQAFTGHYVGDSSIDRYLNNRRHMEVTGVYSVELPGGPEVVAHIDHLVGDKIETEYAICHDGVWSWEEVS